MAETHTRDDVWQCELTRRLPPFFEHPGTKRLSSRRHRDTETPRRGADGLLIPNVIENRIDQVPGVTGIPFLSLCLRASVVKEFG
jgi:hypothetical protein